MNELYLSILTGLSIGFLGSFHCIGMCGPIALALPVHRFSGVQKYGGIMLYNLGRAVTYSLLGFAFGLVGSQFRLWGLQQQWPRTPDRKGGGHLTARQETRRLDS